MTNAQKSPTVLVLTILLLVAAITSSTQAAILPTALPVTGIATIPDSTAQLAKNGVGKVTSVSVGNTYSFSVTQFGNSVPSDGSLGQYAGAASKKNIGLLAHNYLAGAAFASFWIGAEIKVTLSDGSTKTFVINNVMRYQATDPNDFSKPFIDSNGKQISTRALFNRAYKRGGLTFQTCIAGNGSSTWGLLFVLAVPKK